MEQQHPCYYPGEFAPPTKMHLNGLYWLLNRPEVSHVNVVIGKTNGPISQDQKARMWEILLKSNFSPQATIIKSKENGPLTEVYSIFEVKPDKPAYIALDEESSRNKKLQKKFSKFPNYAMQLLPSQFYKSSAALHKAAQNNDTQAAKEELPDDFTDDQVNEYLSILNENVQHDEPIIDKSPLLKSYSEQYQEMFNDGFWKSVFEPMAESTEIDEVIKAGTFTVYHRTETDPKNFNKGFTPNREGVYGRGLYATYEYRDQFHPDMFSYGPNIVEFEIKSNGKFLILDEKEAKKVYGSNYGLLDQLKKILGGKYNSFYSQNKDVLIKLDSELKSKPTATSIIAKSFSKIINIQDIGIDGIVFSGGHDGRVLVLFNTNIANPIRYHTNNRRSWISLKDKSSYKIGRDDRSDKSTDRPSDSLDEAISDSSKKKALEKFKK